MKPYVNVYRITKLTITVQGDMASHTAVWPTTTLGGDKLLTSAFGDNNHSLKKFLDT